MVHRQPFALLPLISADMTLHIARKADYEKTLTPRRAVCGLLAALAAAAAVWLLCRWVGYDLQLRLGDKQQFEIVNDDYSQIIDVPDEGLVQTFPLKAGQSICGVRLNFSTHDALYKCGMVMVDLYDENGQLLGQGAGNFLNIFNDSFTAFAYGGSYTAEKDEVLTLHIYNEVAWDGPLGLWASMVRYPVCRCMPEILHRTPRWRCRS